jgi:DoxX-like family
MHTIADDNPLILTAQLPSRRQVLLGRSLSVVGTLFLILDSTGKLLEVQPVIDETVRLGYSPDIVFTLGVLLLASVVTYVTPPTSVLGALLLTGYLGGAVATHVRVESPLFSHILFPVYVAALLWGGLVLRDARLRALLPLRRPM